MPCKYANIVVSPSNLEFEVAEGWKFVPPYQRILVGKDGSGLPAHWSISIDEDWLSISPYAGEAPKGVRVGCDSPGMAAGSYHGHITVTSAVEITNPVVDVTLKITPKPIANPRPVIPGPSELPDTEPVPEPYLPPDITEWPSPGDLEPPPQPEPEPWFVSLVRWILELFKR